MTPAQDARIRRYLLGQASEIEAAAIEQEYFGGEAALDAVAAEEEALIEDYLFHRLNAADRQHFETAYLASPVHRQRVALMRELAAQSSRSVTKPTASDVSHHPRRLLAAGTLAWGLPVAAALLLTVGLWLFQRQETTDVAVDEPPSATDSAPPAVPAPRVEPRVLSMSLVPWMTRSGDDTVALVIPEGVDVVSLTLQGERVPGTGSLQVVVRTVPGREIWRGVAMPPREGETGVSARAELPARVLPPDDYIVTLSDQGGEVDQYFLRVRER